MSSVQIGECNRTQLNIMNTLQPDFQFPIALSERPKSKDGENSYQSQREEDDVFPELKDKRQRARSISYLPFKSGSQTFRKKSIIHHRNTIEIHAQQGQKEKCLRITVSIIRFFYFLQVLYTGYVFPILIVGLTLNLRYLELGLDILQIAYIVSKLDRQQNWIWNLKNYFKKIDCIELLTLIPFEFWQLPYLQYLYFIKLPRLVNLREQFRNFYATYIGKPINMFWGFLLGFHCTVLWMGAFWIFYCSRWSHPNWISNFCANEGSEMCYMKSIYLILETCLTIGYGDVVPQNFHERVLMCVFMLMGIVMFSYFIGEFSGLVEERFLNTNEREKALAICRDFESRVSGEKYQQLIVKIRKFILRQNPIHLEDEDNFDLLDGLPESFQADISRHFNTILGKMEFFKKFPTFNLVQLMPYMKQLTFDRGQTIVKEGEPSQDIFYVKNGKVGGIIPSCYNIDNKFIFAYFKEESSFGQYEVFPVCKSRKFTVISVEACKLLSVEGQGLKECISQDEALTQQMTQYCQKKIQLLSKILRKSVQVYMMSHNISKIKIQEINIFDNSSNNDEQTNDQNKRIQNIPRRKRATNIKKKEKLEVILQHLKKCQMELMDFIEEGDQDSLPTMFRGESAFGKK